MFGKTHFRTWLNVFQRPVLKPEGENTQRGASPSAPLLSGLFLFLIKDDSCAATRALIYLPPRGIYLASYVSVSKSRS